MMRLGRHEPVSTRAKGMPGPAAIFTRGLHLGGTQWKFHFPNGYGASVINDGYGADAGLYELAVLAGGRITYDTPVTDDVLGWLTEQEVADALDQVEALPPVVKR